MKKGIHPESYRLVAFKDMSNEHVFITRSCVNTRETIDIEGVTYPLVKVEISNTSHPFYTGKMKLVDTAGRVDKFYQRYKQEPSEVIYFFRIHQSRTRFECGFLYSGGTGCPTVVRDVILVIRLMYGSGAYLRWLRPVSGCSGCSAGRWGWGR